MNSGDNTVKTTTKLSTVEETSSENTDDSEVSEINVDVTENTVEMTPLYEINSRTSDNSILTGRCSYFNEIIVNFSFHLLLILLSILGDIKSECVFIKEEPQDNPPSGTALVLLY